MVQKSGKAVDMVVFPYQIWVGRPLVGNERINPQYNHEKLHSFIPDPKGWPVEMVNFREYVDFQGI